MTDNGAKADVYYELKSKSEFHIRFFIRESVSLSKRKQMRLLEGKSFDAGAYKKSG